LIEGLCAQIHDTVNAFDALRVLLLASEASHKPGPDNVTDVPHARKIDTRRLVQSSVEEPGDCEYAVPKPGAKAAQRHMNNKSLGCVLNQYVGKATTASSKVDSGHSRRQRSTAATTANTTAEAQSASSVTQDGNLVRLRLRMSAARYRRDGGKTVESVI